MFNHSRKLIAISLCFLLVFEQSGLAQQAGNVNFISHVGQLKSPFSHQAFRPLHLRYLAFDSNTNNFELLLDRGDLKLNQEAQLRPEIEKLSRYFFIGLAFPNDSFWVNLRPDAPDEILDDNLAKTDLGRVLLEADVQLKKDTSQLTSPATPCGRIYWDKLYQKAFDLFGTTNITIPALTRTWIVPDEIIIRESADNAYIYKASLKIMLEEDYIKKKNDPSLTDPRFKELNKYAAQLIRETIIPELTREVNSSKNYAPLRQVYYSLILAQWFKSKFSESNNKYRDYFGNKDLTNLFSKESWNRKTYYDKYRKSFQEGEYVIEELVDTSEGKKIRKYFSGGIDLDLTGSISTPFPKTSSMLSGTVGKTINKVSQIARIFTNKVTPPLISNSTIGVSVDRKGQIGDIRINESSKNKKIPISLENQNRLAALFELDNIRALVNSHKGLTDLTDEEIMLLVKEQRLQISEFNEGDILFEQGEAVAKNPGVYFIFKGEAKRVDNESIVSEGDVVGEMTYFINESAQKRNATIQATTHLVALHLNIADKKSIPVSITKKLELFAQEKQRNLDQREVFERILRSSGTAKTLNSLFARVADAFRSGQQEGLPIKVVLNSVEINTLLGVLNSQNMLGAIISNNIPAGEVIVVSVPGVGWVGLGQKELNELLGMSANDILIESRRNALVEGMLRLESDLNDQQITVGNIYNTYKENVFTINNPNGIIDSREEMDRILNFVAVKIAPEVERLLKKKGARLDKSTIELMAGVARIPEGLDSERAMILADIMAHKANIVEQILTKEESPSNEEMKSSATFDRDKYERAINLILSLKQQLLESAPGIFIEKLDSGTGERFTVLRPDVKKALRMHIPWQDLKDEAIKGLFGEEDTGRANYEKAMNYFSYLSIQDYIKKWSVNFTEAKLRAEKVAKLREQLKEKTKDNAVIVDRETLEMFEQAKIFIEEEQKQPAFSSQFAFFVRGPPMRKPIVITMDVQKMGDMNTELFERAIPKIQEALENKDEDKIHELWLNAADEVTDKFSRAARIAKEIIVRELGVDIADSVELVGGDEFTLSLDLKDKDISPENLAKVLHAVKSKVEQEVSIGIRMAATFGVGRFRSDFQGRNHSADRINDLAFAKGIYNLDAGIQLLKQKENEHRNDFVAVQDKDGGAWSVYVQDAASSSSGESFYEKWKEESTKAVSSDTKLSLLKELLKTMFKVNFVAEDSNTKALAPDFSGLFAYLLSFVPKGVLGETVKIIDFGGDLGQMSKYEPGAYFIGQEKVVIATSVIGYWDLYGLTRLILHELGHGFESSLSREEAIIINNAYKILQENGFSLVLESDKKILNSLYRQSIRGYVDRGELDAGQFMAEFFRQYILNGEELRNNINSQNDQVKQVLKSVYDIYEKRFGKEFGQEVEDGLETVLSPIKKVWSKRIEKDYEAVKAMPVFSFIFELRYGIKLDEYQKDLSYEQVGAIIAENVREKDAINELRESTSNKALYDSLNEAWRLHINATISKTKEAEAEIYLLQKLIEVRNNADKESKEYQLAQTIASSPEYFGVSLDRLEKASLLRTINDLGVSQEFQKTVLAFENELWRLINGEYASLGYDQNVFVKWHDYSHVVGNTIETLKVLKRIREQNPEFTIPDEVLFIVAIAGIMHDTGYFKKDPIFGTLKVDHEKRSKEFARQVGKQFGLSDQNIELICLIISATEASIQPAHWNKILVFTEKKLKGDTVDVSKFKALLGPFSIDIETKQGLLLLHGAVTGAKLLAVFDINDPRENAIKKHSGLRLEFAEDRNRLIKYLSDKFGVTQDKLEEFIKENPENGAVMELNKISVGSSDAEQVVLSKGFVDFYAAKRIRELTAPYGLDELVDKYTWDNIVKARTTISRMAELNKEKAVSNDDLSRIAEQIALENNLSKDDSANKNVNRVVEIDSLSKLREFVIGLLKGRVNDSELPARIDAINNNLEGIVNGSGTGDEESLTGELEAIANEAAEALALYEVYWGQSRIKTEAPLYESIYRKLDSLLNNLENIIENRRNKKSSNSDGGTSSGSTGDLSKSFSKDNVSESGGIDFRTMNIITESASGALGLPKSISGFNQEVFDIDTMIDNGIIPSAQRIKDSLIVLLQDKDYSQGINNIIGCIADMLIIEEEKALTTEPALKEILVLLDSNKSKEELAAGLNTINILPQEPALLGK